RPRGHLKPQLRECTRRRAREEEVPAAQAPALTLAVDAHRLPPWPAGRPPAANALPRPRSLLDGPGPGLAARAAPARPADPRPARGLAPPPGGGASGGRASVARRASAGRAPVWHLARGPRPS